MYQWNWTVLLTIAVSIAGCGGGGSATPSTPAPTISLALNQSKVSLGSSAHLTWTTTNASGCTASGAWNGTQATSGTAAQTPSAPGQSTYTLTCTGPGGTSIQSIILAVPYSVQKSSYENKMVAAEAIGPQTLPSEVVAGNAVAFADFFQDGQYSMVTHSLEYNAQDPTTANQFGHIHFYKKMGGVWVDNTSARLANNTGCLHPRKAIVADFNKDGLPDVFFACHGFDSPPFSGESPLILLSQPDGSYAKTTIPVTCFCHSAAAADINADGYPDVLVTDMATPFFLINNKDGTFTKDTSRLPNDTAGKPIFTAELIDFNQTGKYDVFFGGHEQQSSGNWPATILPNDGAGAFVTTTRAVLPSAAGYGLPLDIVFTAGNMYVLRTIDDQPNFYGGAAIQKVSYPSLVGQTIYQHSGSYSGITPGFNTQWVNWIIPYQGKIDSLSSGYGVSVSQ